MPADHGTTEYLPVINTVLGRLNELRDQATAFVKAAQQHKQNRRRKIETALVSRVESCFTIC